MEKRNIAVVYGGFSSEEVVSKRSAEGILSFIDTQKYNLFPLLITPEKWVVVLNNDEIAVNKSDFSIILNDQHIKFDFAYITIHGTPGEDGLLQGYLKLMNVPHSTCDVLTAALTFNKYMCNNYLKNFGIRVATSVLVRKDKPYDLNKIGKTCGFPCFVKPNAGGSSFGISKVKEMDNLNQAIEKAFKESDEVIIEQFIEGVEVTCGLYKTKERTVILPITEVISKNEFFDFEAKYTPEKVTEITPARISDELTEAIKKTTQTTYELLSCKGIVRIDYIIEGEKHYLLEVNTTPGMTPTSFIPQQIEAAKLDIKEVFTEIIENAIHA
ncbi:D-alanine--D-alanine ligase [Natronoflexus pectinivorans]|uniref:D-alanine--D-alanine ligase n=1 Tax=Natronoflexus pectinivorans TaxID=682526 RepID=A0A4R2GJR9_9BACT|nr:D-alanine--D-alanine ligase [Natronoflexus pectinivorans]TCO07650.1 D-alanine-D-alanine ligase [Natronoflexus pectinivorans]